MDTIKINDQHYFVDDDLGQIMSFNFKISFLKYVKCFVCVKNLLGYQSERVVYSPIVFNTNNNY